METNGRAILDAMNGTIDRWISRNPVRAFRTAVTMGIVGISGIVGILAGTAIADATAPATDALGIPYTQAQVNAMDWAEKGSFGPVLRVEGDDAVTIDGRLVQTEYIPCAYDPAAIWHEDGSASNCAAIAEWQTARQDAIAELTGN